VLFTQAALDAVEGRTAAPQTGTEEDAG